MEEETTMSVGPLDGLVTGLDTSTLINNLLQVDAQPQQQLRNQQTKLNSQSAAWADIAAKLSALSSATTALAPSAATRAVTASTSDASLVNAVATSASTPSSLSFRVLGLASANQLASSAYSSTTALVGAGKVTIADGAASLGIGKISAGTSIAAGSSTITVSRASSAASLSGHSPTFPIIIGAGSETLSVVINGVAKVATLAAGTYVSLDPIAAQLASQFGGDVSVSVASGALQIASAAEGSAQTVSTITGTAAATLGLDGLDTASSSGTDGLITYGSDQVAVSDTSAGQTVSVGGATVTLAGGHLSAGAAALSVIDTTATTTLADLAAAINTATGSTVRASAIATGASGADAKLILSGTSSGAAHTITVDGGSTNVGGFTTLRAAADARITVGDGASAITLTRSTNTVSDVMPGVTLNLVKADPDTEVTVSTATDVDGLNTLTSTIAKYNGYDSKSNVAGVLLGDSRLAAVISGVRSALQTTLGSGTVRTLSSLGVTVQRDGTYAFDSATFQKALQSDPGSVVSLLSRQATTTDSRATFLSAGTGARTGTSAISISQAATRASVDSGAFGTLAADETFDITQSGVTATFTALAGSDATTVAAGLQAVLDSAGLSMTASVVGGTVHLATKGYGSSAGFSVTSSGSTLAWDGSYAGTDVQGTVGGVPTTGVGQLLVAASGSGSGIALQISASEADVAGAGGALSLGDVSYTGGIAGTLSSLIADLTGKTGAITQAKQSADDGSTKLQTSIDDWTQKLTDKEAAYRQQFAQLETMIGQLRSQQSQLTSQLSGLSSFSG